MQKTGFITMCADFIHEGHFRVLEYARANCHTLIVGLTTDEQMIKEKRQPIMDFEHRRSILKNCKWVDLVVPNNGEDKETAYSQYHFNVLFSSTEYQSRDEFKNFVKKHKNVQVHFIPRTSNISTTSLIRGISDRTLNCLTIIDMGLFGPIIQFYNNDEKRVIKPIHISLKEFDENLKGSNVYNLPVSPPRNWKRLGEIHNHPNIPGINAFREILIQDHVKEWSSYEYHQVVYDCPSKAKTHPAEKNWSHIIKDHQCPKQIIWLHMRNDGPTLKKWIMTNRHEKNFISNLKKILIAVKNMTSDMIKKHVIHGDLHSDNICVNEETLEPKFIDFGWSLHFSFPMDEKETQYYKLCLNTDWDWTHFTDSLKYEYHGENWFSELPFEKGKLF